MDIEGILLTRAITTGNIADVLAEQINPEHFADEELGDIYEYMCDFYLSHKSTPSMAVVKSEFPEFQPKLSKDPLKYHVNRFIRDVKRRKAVELVRGYAEDIDDDDSVADIEVRAMEMARELSEVVPKPRAEKLSEGKKRRDEYYRRKREGIEHGVKIGIPTFDDLTLGIQPHEICIWGGPTGGGKTTGMQYSSISAYLKMRTVLFISLEVEAEQILRKFDVMLADAKIRYKALKALDLNTEEEREWEQILERAESERLEHDIIIIDDLKNCTADKVASLALQYKPDVVVVDYLEEMYGSRSMQDWQQVRESGRGLKQFARTNKIPVITATQLNREGETSYQSAQKIADMLIVIQPDDELHAKNEMKLLMRKYRDGESRKEALMRWNPEYGEIHEKNFAERFPERINKSLISSQRKLEERIEVATITGGRENPWTQRRKNGIISTNGNGHKEASRAGLGTLRTRKTRARSKH